MMVINGTNQLCQVPADYFWIARIDFSFCHSILAHPHNSYVASRWCKIDCHQIPWLQIRLKPFIFLQRRGAQKTRRREETPPPFKVLVLKTSHHALYNSNSKKGTMFQKFSKCEVNAWLSWSLIILPPLWFYVKSNFGEFKRSKNETLNFEPLVNLGLESSRAWLKSKLRTSKIVKNDIFGPFEFTKIWFHVKSEWR